MKAKDESLDNININVIICKRAEERKKSKRYKEPMVE